MKHDKDTLQLIDAARTGDELAIEKLLRIIRDHHMPQRIHRYRRRNVLVDEGEIESAFLKGCWKAIKQVRMDIGNPLLFILWKGNLSVSQLFRKLIRQGVKLTCDHCGAASLGYKAGKVQCGTCGSNDVQTHMILVNESQLLTDRSDAERGAVWDKIIAGDMHVAKNNVWEAATHEITVQEIRARLNGRVLMLFDAIIVEGINRDTSKNYLAEIAGNWGISTTAVAIYLRKLRTAVAAYFEEGAIAA